MKIGILTQPLHTNYGGLLQCWALQRTLKDLGHEPWVVQRMINAHSFRFWMRNLLANLVRPLLGRRRMKFISRREENLIREKTDVFITRHITPRTERIYSSQGLLSDYVCRKYDAYVVGSDQVWRPMYSPRQPDFFLGFLPKSVKVKRIAYAASFGTDEWEYDETLAAQCRRLAGQFDAVSVREAGGVTLCRDRLGVEGTQVLDPTLLHEKSEYEGLVREADEGPSPGNFFCYLLDKTPGMERTKKAVAQALGLKAFEVMPKASITDRKAPVRDKVFPGVTQWLRAFMDAECVLTDSFHGCVFSIIFNRPFVALGNVGRGQARFHSLFSLFGLESRLVESRDVSTVVKVMQTPIDWERVNAVKEKWQRRSMDFLRNALKKKDGE